MATTKSNGALKDSASGNAGGNGLSAAVLKAAASALVQRNQFLDLVGWDTFDGARNIFATLGYKRDLTIVDYRQRYRRGGIAKKLVEFLPKEAWGAGVDIVESDDPDTNTKFETLVDSLFTRLNVVKTLERADILAGLSYYSTIWIGVGSDSKPDEPLPKPLNIDQIIFLNPLAEDRARISKLVDNINDPRWGLPEYYDVITGGAINDGSRNLGNLAPSFSGRVHWSRMIHIVHDPIESDIYGQPTLEDVWNYLTDLDKVVGGGSEIYWRRAKQIIHANVDPEFDKMTPEEGADLDDKLEEMNHNLRDFLRTQGVDLKLLATPIEKFDANVKTLISLIAGTKSIPQRKLVGSEEAQLASEQDRKNSQDIVKQYRSNHCEPVLRQLLGRLIEFKALPALSKSTDYKIVWGGEQEMSLAEKITMIGSISTANENQFRSEGKVIMTSDEIRDEWLDKDPLPEPEIDPEIDPESETGDDEDEELIEDDTDDNEE